MSDKTEERQMDYYPVPGMHVRDAAAALVVIAEARGETVRAEFNKVEMQANSEIAKRLGRASKTIYTWRRQYGWPGPRDVAKKIAGSG